MSKLSSSKNPLTVYIPKYKHLSGLVAVFLGSLFCIWLNSGIADWTQGRLVGLSSLTLAILIGMVFGNTVYPKLADSLSDGVNYSKGQILRLAIVLYGFKITLTQVAGVGFSAIIIDALVLSSTFFISYLLGTKVLKMDKTTSILIGSGASICGAAAVIATQPVVKAETHKVTIAVATVVVFGTIAMLLYPYLYAQGWLNGLLTAQQYGIYTGSTVHEVAQVVVAGNAVNPEVGNTAVVTKMIRVMMLAPFLLILSMALTQSSQATCRSPKLKSTSTSKSLLSLQRLKQVHIPWFAFVFIAMVGVNSLLSASDIAVIERFTDTMVTLDDLLLTMAMFALGLTTHLSAIKQAGVKPLILGAIMFGWLIFGGAVLNILGSFI